MACAVYPVRTLWSTRNSKQSVPVMGGYETTEHWWWTPAWKIRNVLNQVALFVYSVIGSNVYEYITLNTFNKDEVSEMGGGGGERPQ
jgi:hypothetical protein